MSVVILYHGAHRWDGPPEIRPAKSMKVIEHGPGFYLTSGEETARKYAKGGGVVLQFEVEAPLVWAENVRIPLHDAMGFVSALPRLRHRKEILHDLRERSQGRPDIWAPMLGNLMHYYGVAHGENGVELIHFYRQYGIDADRTLNRGARGDETWVILYNLKKILRYRKI